MLLRERVTAPGQPRMALGDPTLPSSLSKWPGWPGLCHDRAHVQRSPLNIAERLPADSQQVRCSR
jgi:hypothetical protein